MPENSCLDISSARRLLDRYYNGTASPEETAALVSFFSRTPAAKLPADMREDAELLSLAAAESAESANAYMPPEGLESELSALIDSLAHSETESRRKKRPRILYLALGMAAAAAVAIFLVTPALKLTDQPILDLAPEGVADMTAQTASTVEDKAAESTCTPQDITAEAADTDVPAPPTKPRRKSIVRHPAHQVDENLAQVDIEYIDTNTGHIYEQDYCEVEITDPGQAERITRRALATLASIPAMQSQPIAMARTAVGSIEDTFNTIIQ